MNNAISHFCSKISKDKLLVQGPGGNVSWKDGQILWIKASGKWFKDASRKDFFVPVNYIKLKNEVELGNFNFQLHDYCFDTNNPSIETLMHILMPQKIVLHLHMIEVLAHTLKTNFKYDFFLKDFNFSYAVIDYFNPGADLASAIHNCLKKQKTPNIIFLRNHGVILGAENLTDLKIMLLALSKKFKTDKNKDDNLRASLDMKNVDLMNEYMPDYNLIEDDEIQEIALNERLYSRLSCSWAIIPDHIVFLGSKPIIFSSLDFYGLMSNIKKFKDQGDFFFVENIGVFANSNFNNTQFVQLKTYFDIISRLNKSDKIDLISGVNIKKLINLESEKYRIAIAG